MKWTGEPGTDTSELVTLLPLGRDGGNHRRMFGVVTRIPGVEALRR